MFQDSGVTLVTLLTSQPGRAWTGLGSVKLVLYNFRDRPDLVPPRSEKSGPKSDPVLRSENL